MIAEAAIQASQAKTTPNTKATVGQNSGKMISPDRLAPTKTPLASSGTSQ